MSSTPPRRFKVEPIETTVKTSKDSSPLQPGSTKPARRFAPEPIETNHKSHRRRKSQEKFAQEWNEWETEAVQTFKTQPSETTGRSNRKLKGPENLPPRRFAPQLIETARRSRKAGDTTPAVLPSDKTDQEAYNPKHFRRSSPPPPPENTPTTDISHNPLFLEIKRATSSLTMRRPSWASMRSHHSFRVPELDPIESSESEASCPPSPSTAPAATSRAYMGATRVRESVDARSSGYLLELAAKAAEKQLREQAMAAFPNDDHYERVDHYIDHDSDGFEPQTEDATHRRESHTIEGHWEYVAMQQHREKLERQLELERNKKMKQEATLNRPQRHTPWGNAAALINSARGKELLGGDGRDGELDRMRKGARPPMLGGDIKFPRCPSPEPSRFDTTQGCDATRIAMCYLSEQSHAAENGDGQHLWCGNKKPGATPSFYSTSNAPSRAPSQTPSHGGLWGGCCVNTGETPPRGPTGLLTPNIEIDNPMSPCPSPAKNLMPPTPPPSNADFACIDEKLAAEAAIEEDFGDDFVTQVYNYLSLGYPSIARMFDEELSKISNIPIAELRQDDHLPSSTGYIRLGEDGNLADSKITEETCMRWRALRVYVKVWARQHPGMATDSIGGIAVRKGSWAV